MKYAVITDIHSNIHALRAVLAEIDRHKPDKIICLGDIVGGGAFPDETVSLLRKRKDILCVKGNHDMFATLDLEKIHNGDQRIKFFKWQQRALSTASRNYLSSLPYELSFKDDGINIVCLHYPRDTRGKFKSLIYLPNEEQVKGLFSGISGDLFLFGHEHTGSLTEYLGKTYLNFGTLGNFIEKDVARYGIVEIKDKKISYESFNAYYDDTIAREKAQAIQVLLT